MKPKNYGHVKKSVEKRIKGIITKLVLHPRLNLPKGRKEKPFWVVSWRSRLKNNKTNRRFYNTLDEFWEIPIKDACIMFNEVFKKGGLDSKYDDRWNDGVVKKRIKCLKRVGGKKYFGDFSTILAKLPEDQAIWNSKNLTAIIFKEPKNNQNPGRECWKVMLVDLQRQMVTFRTIANNADYGMKKNCLKDPGWFMDKAMMDTDPCVMRCFRRYLLRLQKQCRQVRRR